MGNMMDRMPPVHPGEIFLEEFMNPLGLSQSCLACATGMEQSHIQDIIGGQQGIMGYGYPFCHLFWYHPGVLVVRPGRL